MKESEYCFDAAPLDMGNHSDTHVFGVNVRVYFMTSKTCTVSPFLPDYYKQLDVPIVAGTTAVDLINGYKVVFIFG